MTHLPRETVKVSRAGSCECALCQRGRRYYKNTESLLQEERDWMRGFYDAVLDEECEREMQAANRERKPRPVCDR